MYYSFSPDTILNTQAAQCSRIRLGE